MTDEVLLIPAQLEAQSTKRLSPLIAVLPRNVVVRTCIMHQPDDGWMPSWLLLLQLGQHNGAIRRTRSTRARHDPSLLSSRSPGSHSSRGSIHCLFSFVVVVQVILLQNSIMCLGGNVHHVFH